ncbi:MAG: 16S rRNA (guanine(966)-N(2))-methyltransferase RsmD [Acidimicrobiia bacterium]
MRIIAGKAKRRSLRVPSQDTRPMTARAREGLFSSLGPIEGARVLDLYAGSGSLGLEALSRGARSATFVDRSPDAVDALETNVRELSLGGTVLASSVGAFLRRSSQTFDLAFVDPPYAESLASVIEVMSELEPRLAPGATVVVRRRVGEDPPKPPSGLHLVSRRRYGDDELFRYQKDTR